jgi:predicted Zn finger-like uncharacterized protein
MALATKCPHCNTIFRVAADQLKLRGGIVRCGACNEVFDGNAALVEPAARPTPLIPEVVIAPPAASPASNYIQGAPVDFDLDALDAAEAGVPEQAAAESPDDTATGAEPARAEDITETWLAPEPEDTPAAPAVWRTAAFTTPAPMPEPESGLAPESEPEPEAGPELTSAPQSEPMPEFASAAQPTLEPTPESALAPEPLEEAVAEAAEEPAQDAAFALDAPDAAIDAHGRIEPSFDTPQEHIVAVALDDLHHFDDLEEPEPTPAELQAVALAELHHLGPGEDQTDEEGPRDDTALHAIAAVHTDVADDGPSLRTADDEPEAEPGLGAPVQLAPDPKGDMAARMRALAGVDESASETLDHEELGFVKRANRSERYGHAARVTMAVGTPLLLLALLLQGATTFRNTLAADYPSLKPALATACSLLGCKIELPSQLDMLSIEQGELQTVADNTFSFATVLRNQSRTAQAWPHIELILNDSADKPVLRRVFAPRDYLASAADADKGFAPRSEQTVKLYFELSQLKASGYHIAIFYP